MSLKKIITLFFILVYNMLVAQNVVIIYKGNVDTSINLSYLYREIGNNYATLSIKNRMLKFESNSPTFVKCDDILRNTLIYVEPNETISININNKGLLEYSCEKNVFRKNESLLINELYVKYGVIESVLNKKMISFITKQNTNYDENYTSEKKMLEKSFKESKISKSFYVYFKMLIYSLTIENKMNNPKKFEEGVSELKKSFINPKDFLDISEYRICLLLYLNDKMRKEKTKSDIYSTLKFISTNFTNQEIKNYLSYNVLKLNIINSKQKIDDSSLDFFYLICKNQQFLNDIKADFSQNANSIFLKKILDKSECELLIIDFWASWCKPCLEELPYIKKQINKYPKVKYVFISIDNSKSDWMKMTQKYSEIFNSNNSFLFREISDKDNYFKNIKITTIPRLILIDKNGKIINYNFPRPSESTFNTMLDKY